MRMILVNIYIWHSRKTLWPALTPGGRARKLASLYSSLYANRKMYYREPGANPGLPRNGMRPFLVGNGREPDT